VARMVRHSSPTRAAPAITCARTGRRATSRRR
jgi:hypothetical protein